jgi:hypothetical protein
MERSLPSLAQLRGIRADLLREKVALESLRKQIQREEAVRAAKVAYVGQPTKKFPRSRAAKSSRLSQSIVSGLPFGRRWTKRFLARGEEGAGAEGEVK